MYSFAQRVQSVYCKACSGGVDGLKSLTVLGDQKEAILPVRMAPFHHAAYRAAIFHKTVSSMLGHYSTIFTLDTYAHVTTDDQLKAAQTISFLMVLLPVSTKNCSRE